MRIRWRCSGRLGRFAPSNIIGYQLSVLGVTLTVITLVEPPLTLALAFPSASPSAKRRERGWRG